MKVSVTSSSNSFNNKVIEAASIDDAIKKIQNDKDLVLSIIDNRYSNMKYENYIPDIFVVNTNKTSKYDIEIEIYDTYRE